MIQKTVKGTGLSLTPAIESSINKVIETIDKYVDPTDTSAMAQIEVAKTTNHHRTGDVFRAEINFHSRLGDFRAECEKDDLYSAIIAVKDELIESLRSRKAKKADFVRRSGLKLKNMLRGLPWKKKQ